MAPPGSTSTMPTNTSMLQQRPQMPKLQPGLACTIHGLHDLPGCPAINGESCILIQFEREKWLVELPDDTRARIPPAALIPSPQQVRHKASSSRSNVCC